MYTNKRYSWLYNHSNIISIKIIKVKQRTFMTNFGKDINSVLFSKANNLLEVYWKKKTKIPNKYISREVIAISSLPSYSGISYVP